MRVCPCMCEGGEESTCECMDEHMHVYQVKFNIVTVVAIVPEDGGSILSQMMQYIYSVY
jgi:hypothetical protein